MLPRSVSSTLFEPLGPAVRDAVGSLGGKELRSLIEPKTATIEVIEPHQL